MFVTLDPRLGSLLVELQSIPLTETNFPAVQQQIRQLHRLAQECRESQREQTAAEPQESQTALASEQTEVDWCFDNFLLCLHAAANAEPFSLQAALHDVDQSSQRLAIALFRWREVALSERGPTTHPGLNEIFQLVGTDTVNPLNDELELVLDREMAREHALSDVLDILNQDFADFQQDYRQFLCDLPVDDWETRLQQLGQRFQQIDLSFLDRHYGDGPTPLRWLNLAHQACSLWSSSALSDSLAATTVERALLQLEALPDFEPQVIRERLSSNLTRLAQLLEGSPTEEAATLLSELERLAFQLADIE